MLQAYPDVIEGIFIQDEEVTLRGTTPTELAHPRVLRNASTDIVLTSPDGSLTCVLDRDYTVAGDIGTYVGRAFTGGTPFTVARTPNSRIPDGATMLASYDCVGARNDQLGPHVPYCPSDPRAVDFVGKTVEDIASRWNLKYLHIRADEIPRANSDSRCRRRNLPTTEILLEHLRYIRDRIHQGNPDTQVAMWEDAFSPYHGGQQWGFTEDGPAPPEDILQFVWFYEPLQATTLGWASLAHYQKFGLTTLACPWFKLQNIREWAQVVGEARRRGWKCLGMVDTIWGGPPPFKNVRETAIVSWKIPSEGEPGWVPFTPPSDER